MTQEKCPPSEGFGDQALDEQTQTTIWLWKRYGTLFSGQDDIVLVK